MIKLLTFVLACVILSCATTPPKPVAHWSCRLPDIWDLGPEDWKPLDESALQSRIAYCERTYERNPCLVKFTRWKTGQYTYRCGPMEKTWTYP